ncbi:MAG TPA: hypothetical protein DIT96_02825 [Pseudomonas sp.]|nr:hypothetical protein [Pseudomonas sp.]
MRAAADDTKHALVTTIQKTAEELNGISEETAASLLVISSQTDDIAVATKQGLSFVADTQEKSKRGQQQLQDQNDLIQVILQSVNSLEVTMNQLRTSSQKISEIVGLVTGIADQTNLLALNASIEAARAGEHGKGFAVVAQEIRILAERSKTSSEKITDILQGISDHTSKTVVSLDKSMTEAQAGTHIANKAGQTFSSIVESIQKVSDQIDEVSAASEQLSSESELVTASLTVLEGIANSSSADSAHVAASSEEQLAAMQEVASFAAMLYGLADELKQSVDMKLVLVEQIYRSFRIMKGEPYHK